MQGRPSDFDRVPKLCTTWVRREYYIEAGYIKPVGGSRVELYDPFESGYYTAGSRLDGQPLYVTLYNLNLADERDVREFVSSWGLLGLFQHELELAQYLATPDGDGMDLRVLAPEEDPDCFFVITERPNSTYRDFHNANPPEWRRPIPGLEHVFEVAREQARRILATRAGWGTVITRTCINPMRLDVPLAGAAPPLDGPMRLIPLEAYYDQYFPAGHYPSTTSSKLWDHLCEPVSMLRSAIGDFRKIYDRSVQRKNINDPISLLRLNFHLSGVRPVVTPSHDGESHLGLGWAFPSLLSAAYTMLCRDLSTPHRFPRICERRECARAFVTDRSDRRYCSARCGTNERVRRLRTRNLNSETGDS